MPDLIDTHAHLDDERFRDDLPAVLARGRQRGLGAAGDLEIGIALVVFKPNIEFMQNDPTFKSKKIYSWAKFYPRESRFI